MTSSEWGIPRKRGPEETLKRFSKSSKNGPRRSGNLEKVTPQSLSLN